MKKIEAIDLFCGAGGLTRGLIDAGVSVLGGYDIDASCCHAYEANNPGATFHCKDVASVTGAELNRLWSNDSIRLLAGCAPCQPFSPAAHASKVDEDPRYTLLDHFTRLTRTCKPDLVTMENVPSVQKSEPFVALVETLEDLGYAVAYGNVACTDYGVPQTRRRMVLLASRLSKDAPELAPGKEKAPSVGEAIAGLKALQAGEFDPEDPVHIARDLSPLNMKRMKYSKAGGSWKDWPTSLLAECMRKSSGASFRHTYSRMTSDAQSPTITTLFHNFGTGRFGHPTQHRAITPREAAILQSFPRDYEFVEPGQPVHITTLGRLIGNAVPPKLGAAIGNAFVAHVRGCQGRVRTSK